MKRIVPITLSALLGLAFGVPAFSQGRDCNNENKDWQEIQDQRDARRQAELDEAFIKCYSTSPHRPDLDKTLVTYWASNKDYAKIVNWADAFKTSLPSADAASKGVIYTQGMMAAASLNNVKKVTEFGGLALAAEPNNFLVLSFLASSNLLDQKTSIEYAKKAAALPRPATMADAQYQSLLTRVKAIAANNGGGGGGGNAAQSATAGVLKSAQDLMAQKKYQEAIDMYKAALKDYPKDSDLNFSLAVAHYYVMSDAAQGVQAANDEQIKAMAATPVVQADVDKAAAKKEQLTKATLDSRDAAIEALGKTLAIGNPKVAAQAKQLFDALYQNKNKSMDGADQFIADKKKELGL